MLNAGTLREAWEEAYESPSVTQDFAQVVPALRNSSADIPVPNLNTDTIGIHMQGSLVLDASGAQAVTVGAIATDIITNLTLKDPEGKAVLDISWQQLFNYVSWFLNANPVITPLAPFGGAGQATYVFDVILPVFIPKNQGIHKLVFYWNIANIYPALVTVNNASIIYLTLIGNDAPNLEKWKATTRQLNLIAGLTAVTEWENDRGWYAIFVTNLATAGVLDVGQTQISNAGFPLINSNYPALNAEYLQRYLYAPRYAGDTILQFRPHIHMSTDIFTLTGTVAEAISIMVIASADTSRVVTTPEVTAPNVTQQITPAVVQPVYTQQTQPLATNQGPIMPVRVNIGY